ncbi:fam-l protein [Plasmodium malariae]|uniref:Fam-l protein n=1 Tax=Plasmodium malariae TaxID=5858 RepID=A0A1D3JIA7_PLAMA|nr:fam-l protein [Plasmodium malariae]SBT86111.1 fam-l protein [Plasmodium malariae]
MEEKIKSLSFNKIVTFILLSWISHFVIYMSKYNKSLYKCYNSSRILYITNCRLLAKYKEDKNPNIVCLKEELPNGVNNKKDIYINESLDARKKKQSNCSSSSNTRDHKAVMKNKSCIFETNKYSYLEKKIFKELDYVHFLKNNKTISDKLYKKIIGKRRSLKISFPLILFLLLFIAFIVECFSGYGASNGIYILLFTCIGQPNIKTFRESWFGKLLEDIFKTVVDNNGTGRIIFLRNICFGVLYMLLFIILGTVFISVVIYYHKKVNKYNKIKFRKR